MKLFLFILPLLAIIVTLNVNEAHADSTGVPDNQNNRPIIGLTLSGGGAKGFAEIGVLKVLEEAGIDADVVTGTSMGAMIGGLYAIGYSAAEIESLAVYTDWSDLMDDSPGRRELEMELKQFDERYQISLPFDSSGVALPSGFITGQKIGNMLNRMTWHVHDDSDFTKFPRKFACIATDLCAGNVVVLNKGFLPEAMRASMAIPGVFTAVRIGDQLLVDGSIARNFPVQDARELGATFIIGVDVGGAKVDSKQLKSVIDIIAQSFNYNDVTSSEKQRKLCDILIEPDISDIPMLDFSNAGLAIQRGEEAARKVFPQLKKLAQKVAASNPPKRILFGPSKTVKVDGIKIEGLHRTTAVLVKSRIDFKTPAVVTAHDLEESINNIYSSGFYERVSYRLRGNDDVNTMEIIIVEKESDLLRFGFHYDSDQKAAAILNTTMRNLLYRGTLTTFDVILGSEEHYILSHLVTTNLKPRIGIRLLFDHERYDALFTSLTQGTSIQRLHTTKAGLFVGTVYSTAFVAGGGFDWNYNTSSVLTSDSNYTPSITENFYAYNASIQLETLDRIDFPTSGVKFTGLGRLAERKLGSRRDFRTISTEGASYIPLSKTWTVSGGFTFADNIGSDLPVSSVYWFGGIDDFLGYGFQEKYGNSKQILRAGLQWEPWTKKLLLLRANVGNVYDKWEWNFKPSRYVTGMGLTAGWITVAGPIQFTVHGTETKNLLYNFRFGYMF